MYASWQQESFYWNSDGENGGIGVIVARRHREGKKL